MHNFSRAGIVKNKTKSETKHYYKPMGIHRNEFAANLNLKEHQFFFTHPVYVANLFPKRTGSRGIGAQSLQSKWFHSGKSERRQRLLNQSRAKAKHTEN